MMARMILTLVVSLLFLCAAIGVVLAAYLWLLSYDLLHDMPPQRPLEDNAKLPKQQGLSETELQQLPTVECHEEEECPSGCGKAECVVCLEPFQCGQRCRVIPACSHAFHVLCADAWLSRRANCPICRRSAACEGNVKNGGGAASASQQEELRDEESGRSRPLPTSESVVVDMSVVSPYA